MEDTHFWSEAEIWMAQRSPDAKVLWAKSGDLDSYLSLPQHLLDTACVAKELWGYWVADSLKAALSRQTTLSPDQLGSIFIFLAGTHDLGKATITFQRLIENRAETAYLVEQVADAGFSLEPSDTGEDLLERFAHGTASGRILKLLLKRWGMDGFLAESLASVVDAHHGLPSSFGGNQKRTTDRVVKKYAGKWGGVHEELFSSMLKLSGCKAALHKLNEAEVDLNASVLQPLVGLVVMADWIASNSDAFPYSIANSQQQRVEKGLTDIELTGTWAPVDLPESALSAYTQSFNWAENYSVRPVQATAFEEVKKSSGPTLIIIEAPTGEGKTEAGLMAAHILAARSGSQGVFFAAPTMSTANGLFHRTVQWAQHASPEDDVTSMYLAHSKNVLSKEFRKLRSIQGIYGQGDDHANVVATQWLSGPKKGLLANFGVGTVDQVLMLSLQMRHSMLRHVALAGKTVIIDEVHSYDTYMSEYLGTTLAWLARYGANVILLSATLPPAQRAQLVRAFASEVPLVGETVAQDQQLSSEAYPVLTVVDSKGLKVVPVPQSPNQMTASIQVLPERGASLLSLLNDKLSDGGIALIICNTVHRSQETYRLLKGQFAEDVQLHHAAFLASERSDKEERLRDLLGPGRTAETGRPSRLIIVATQVAEQSLDIDADILVTDMVPMDLLIQRIGRLHRHARPEEDRPEKVRSPQVYVRAIEEISPYPVFEGGAVAVYGEKLLLSSLANLPKWFSRPEDIAPLVRAAYADQPEIPDAWVSVWDKAVKKERESSHRAKQRAGTYRIPEPRASDLLRTLFSRLHSDSLSMEKLLGEEAGVAQVRDSEPAVEVIVIRRSEEGYSSFAADSETQFSESLELAPRNALELAQSTVRLPVRMTRNDSDFEEIISQLEEMTPLNWRKNYLLKGQVALALDHEGRAKLGRFELLYDLEVGLQVSESSARE